MANYPYGFNAATYQPQPYFQQPYQPQPYQQFQPQQAAQPKTNKVFVTSLDDALSRVCEPNSEMLYLHQDEPLLFEIKTDAQGRKTYKTYAISEDLPQDGEKADGQEFVLKEDFERLEGEFKALRDKLARQSKTTGGRK